MAQLRKVEKDLSALRAAHEPGRWLLLGRADADEEPGRCDLQSRQDWRAGLEEARGALTALEPELLPLAQRLSLRALAAFVRSELVLATACRPETYDPSWYTERLLAGLQLALCTPEGHPQGARALIARLQAVDVGWQAARRGLVLPSRSLCELALARCDDLAAFLEGELLRSPLRAKLAPEDVGALEAARVAALAATRDARAWIEAQLLPRAGAAPSMGAPSWLALLEAATGEPRELGPLEADLLAAIARNTPNESSAPLKPQLDPQGMFTRIAAWSRAGRELWARLGLCPMEPLPLSATFAPMRGMPGEIARVELDASRSLRLRLGLPNEHWDPAAFATRARALGPEREAWLGLRFGAGAEGFVLARVREKVPADRQLLIAQAQIDGRALYLAEAALRTTAPGNLFREQKSCAPALREALQLEYTRLWAALALHARGLPLERVIEDFARYTRLDALSARAEVIASLTQPARGAGVLVYEDLKALEARVPRREAGAGGGLQMVAALTLALEHPELRACDLGELVKRKPEPAPVERKEIPGGSDGAAPGR